MKKVVVCIIVVIMLLIGLLFFIKRGKSNKTTNVNDSNAIEIASGESAIKDELFGSWKSPVNDEAKMTFNEDGTGEIEGSEEGDYKFEYSVSTEVVDGQNTKYVTIKIEEIDQLDKIRYVVSGDILFLDTENHIYINNMRRDR